MKKIVPVSLKLRSAYDSENSKKAEKKFLIKISRKILSEKKKCREFFPRFLRNF